MSNKVEDLVKRPHLTEEYTVEQTDEIEKCLLDPVYFMRNYVKVQHPKYGTVPFDLFSYQERLVRAIQQHRDVITLQPRQSGKCVSDKTSINIIIKPKGIRALVYKLIFGEFFEKPEL